MSMLRSAYVTLSDAEQEAVRIRNLERRLEIENGHMLSLVSNPSTLTPKHYTLNPKTAILSLVPRAVGQLA
jgi:hypothetical protein